jgi:hypothetical protein
MIKFSFKDILRDFDAICDVLAFRNLDQVLDVLKLILHSRGSCVGAELLNKSLWALKEYLSIRSSISE